MVDITLVNAGPNLPRQENGTLLKPAPLGVLSLAAWLRFKGLTSEILDYQLENGSLEDQLNPDCFTQFLETRVKSETIGISVMGGMLPIVLLALENFKKAHPNHRIILGGSGPSAVAKDILEKFLSVDYVVCGEGEETLEELLTRKVDLKSIPGLVFRHENEIIRTPRRCRIQNLDTLPIPAYDMIDLSRYAVVNVSTSRGCPYHCAFCESPAFWHGGTTERSIDSVIQEIKLLNTRYGKQQINICDDTFVANRQRVIEFCDKIKSEKLTARWECFARIDLMDDELMNYMSDAGCTAIFFGVESGSDKILKHINKHIDVNMARKVVTRALTIFPYVYTSFVWGFPFETMEDFFDTVLLMTEFALLGARVQRPHLSLRPQSPIFPKYRNQIAYSSLLPMHFLEVPKEYLPQNVENLIKENPSIFTPFYYIQSPGFEEKRVFMQFLESLGNERWKIISEKINSNVEETKKGTEN